MAIIVSNGDKLMSSQELMTGFHAVTTLLEVNPKRVIKLHIQKERVDERVQLLLQLAKDYSISVHLCSRQFLDQLSPDTPHQGFVALCHPIKPYTEKDLLNLLDQLARPPCLLVLDGVQDPRNLGACLRSARAAGVDGVIAPRDRSVGLTPVACKAACGAAETVPFVQVTNLARALRMLKDKGIWIYGMAEKAKRSLYTVDLTGALAFVLGSEGKGLRHLTQELCDEILMIPTKDVSSNLNVSVATAVCLFECVRQRNLLS